MGAGAGLFLTAYVPMGALGLIGRAVCGVDNGSCSPSPLLALVPAIGPFLRPTTSFLFVAACGLSTWSSACGPSSDRSGWIANGTADLDHVTGASTVTEGDYTGPIAIVRPANVRGIDSAGVDVHVYAQDRGAIFGLHHWYLDSTGALLSVSSDDHGLHDRAQTVFTMPQGTTVVTELISPGTGAVEVFYSQGPEMAYCLEKKLDARRCRETNGLGCDIRLAALMQGHDDCAVPF
jgi:hypothetical protein